MKTTFLRRTLALIATGMCILTANAQQKDVKTTTSSSDRFIYNNQYMNFDEDSTVSPPRTYANYFNGRTHYNITLADGNVIEMYVNGHKIPADSFKVYSDVVTKLKEQIKRDRLQAIEDMKQAERDRAQAEEDRKQAVRDQEQAVRDRAQAEEDRKQAVRDQEQAVRDREQAERDRVQAEEDRKMIDSLKTDLVTEHVVADKASVRSVILNEDALIVNGKTQPEELLKKFRAKYLKKPGYTITMGEHFMQFGNSH